MIYLSGSLARKGTAECLCGVSSRAAYRVTWKDIVGAMAPGEFPPRYAQSNSTEDLS